MDDFGGRLRQARERRGVSLRQIAASTKIAPAALEALERNDVSKLPGGIFSRAFVRSYAIEVGLDPDDTVRQFLEQFDQEPVPAAAVTAGTIPDEEREFHQRQQRATRVLIAGGVALVMFAAAGAMVYRARARARAPQQAAPQSPTPPQPESAPPATAAPSSSAASSGLPGVTASAAGQKPDGPASTVQLGIQPTADCWVSVTVDGKKAFARVVPAGETQTVAITEEATVEIGDAGAFAYTIDGKPGRPLGTRGQVRTLKLTPATAAQFIR